MDVTWSSSSALRRAFLKAQDGGEWCRLIDQVLAAVEGSAGLDRPGLVLRIECAGIAAHYAYLLRWTECAHRLVSVAERCAEEVRDPAWRDRAQLAYLTGKHRLYRNQRTKGDGDTSSFETTNRSLINLVEQLSRVPDRLTPQETFQARLELAHANRNEGKPDRALADYTSLAGEARDDEVMRLLVYHYGVSLVCDFVELLLLRGEPLELPPSASAWARAEELRRRFLPEYRTRLEDLLRHLPSPSETTKFPFLDALFHKHRALWLAWTDRLEQAQDELSNASELFARFVIPKPYRPTKGQVLCRGFDALVQARKGDPYKAIEMLESVARDSHDYYPRLERRASTHLCFLRHLLGQPLRREEVDIALGAFNRLDRRKVLPLAVSLGFVPPDELERLDQESGTRIEQVYLDRLPAWLSGLRKVLSGETIGVMALAGVGPGTQALLDAQVGFGSTGVRPVEQTEPQATPAGASPPMTGETSLHAGQEGGVGSGVAMGARSDKLSRWLEMSLSVLPWPVAAVAFLVSLVRSGAVRLGENSAWFPAWVGVVATVAGIWAVWILSTTGDRSRSGAAQRDLTAVLLGVVPWILAAVAFLVSLVRSGAVRLGENGVWFPAWVGVVATVAGIWAASLVSQGGSGRSAGTTGSS